MAVLTFTPHMASVSALALCAHRWVLQHPLVTSAVIGATSSAQLAEQLTAAEQPSLPQDLLEAIDRVHSRFPNPTP